MFTDYRRRPNNLKLKDLLDFQFEELSELFQVIGEWKAVDNAEGDVLDEIGKDIGLDRNGSRDEVFRVLLKAKLLSNSSGGDVYTVVRMINNLLELEYGEFKISEAYHDDIKLAGTVNIEQLPLEAMLEKGLTVKEFTDLVKATLAAGVGIASLEVTGTFDFVNELITGSETGFSDIEMTTGGTLSQVFEEGEYGV